MAAPKTPSVPSLERGLALLEILAESKDGVSLAHLARSLKLPKSSIHCLLLTLERRGYLERDELTGRYMFSLKLLSLANMALTRLRLREVVRPFLNALVKSTVLTAHLAILEQGEAVLIEKIEPPGLLRLATWVGKRLELHCTGLGKALIAYLPEEELERLIREHSLHRHNENTIASARKLKEELKGVRNVGYSVDDEEDEIGVRCIGSPVFDRLGRVIGAISVAGTTGQITPENLRSLGEKVKQTATAVSRTLGFAPGAGALRP